LYRLGERTAWKQPEPPRALACDVSLPLNLEASHIDVSARGYPLPCCAGRGAHHTCLVNAR
jgi:hypothetical protein